MNDAIYTRVYDTPCGKIVLGSFRDKLCLCDWLVSRHRERNDRRVMYAFDADVEEGASDVINQAIAELDEYFEGRRKSIDVPYQLVGTEFQIRVWHALCEIPYGATKTYFGIAEKIGNRNSVRAVAQAIGANPIALVVPCHRVIGADGSLTGFAGGLEAKKMLLQLEADNR